MKCSLPLNRLGLAVSLAMILLSTATSPAQTPKSWKGPFDPILGRWRWFNTQFKIFKEDGTVRGPRGEKQGTWKFLKDFGEPRHYEVNWEHSLWIDRLQLVKNLSQLTGKNQEGFKVSAYRVLPDS